jgi:hypothetical protein
MFPGVHDSLLVSYSVNSESQELLLSIKPHHDSAPAPFAVLFKGVAAHSFDTPVMPAILYGITRVSAGDLIRAEWPAIERGFKLGGWPGPWADTLVNATDFVESKGLNGFQIESSYGLSGWVLAQSAGLLASGP